MPWTCRCWSAMNTHHITILQARSVQKISTVCLFTHLRIITHPFTSWGSSFLTIYTQASVPGRYHWSCSENIRKSWWWTQQIIKRFRLPLFNICGSTFSNASLSVASAFLSSEDKELFKCVLARFFVPKYWTWGFKGKDLWNTWTQSGRRWFMTGEQLYSKSSSVAISTPLRMSGW